MRKCVCVEVRGVKKREERCSANEGLSDINREGERGRERGRVGARRDLVGR